jgi:hypothetical protein
MSKTGLTEESQLKTQELRSRIPQVGISGARALLG